MGNVGEGSMRRGRTLGRGMVVLTGSSESALEFTVTKHETSQHREMFSPVMFICVGAGTEQINNWI